MCLILISYKQYTAYPLVIAANRDEFFERPTQAAQFWQDVPTILAGRDLKHKGTWLGIERRGRLAAVTNYREPSERKSNVISRGQLVSNFLMGDDSPESYLTTVSENKNNYDGFNLFVADQQSLYFFNSFSEQPIPLQAGIHGISNGELNSSWPKVVTGKQKLDNLLNANLEIDLEAIFKLLADTSVPDDELLPDTGIGLEWERRLAPLFINAGEYGTRSSSILIINENGKVNFAERSYEREGNQEQTIQYEFPIER